MRNMTRRGVCFLIALLVLSATTVDAAGTVTVTQATVVNTSTRRVVRYTVAWVSTAGGAVSANSFSIGAGTLVSARFIPDSGGTQPTDLYDVTLTDSNS